MWETLAYYLTILCPSVPSVPSQLTMARILALLALTNKSLISNFITYDFDFSFNRISKVIFLFHKLGSQQYQCDCCSPSPTMPFYSSSLNVTKNTS